MTDWSVEIHRLCELLDRYYLHEDVAERVAGVLRTRLADGTYAAFDTEQAFADAVTADTVDSSGDLHLRLRYSARPLPDAERVPESGRDPVEAAATGHGFARIERLAGNIGLLDIRRFWPLSMSRHAAIAAMHLVADTEALLIDLRSSAGGEPEMVSFLCSYLFDERTHLNDLYFPADHETIEWWTDPDVSPPRFGGTKPIWVLISDTTISAAEEMAYDLQQLGRATLVGQTTVGAANFDYRYRVTDHLMFSVPSGHPVNPVSGTHWEGTGVEPDVPAGAHEAFDVAHRAALDHVATHGDTISRREAERALGEIGA